ERGARSGETEQQLVLIQVYTQCLYILQNRNKIRQYIQALSISSASTIVAQVCTITAVAICTSRAKAEAALRGRKLKDSLEEGLIGIGGRLTAPPLPHHRAYGSVPRRFESLANTRRTRTGGRAI